MIGFTPPSGIYTHIAGIDLVRTSEKEFFVLEDNVRTPSGVSYMIENRETMYNMFPELFSKIKVRSVTEYPSKLLKALNVEVIKIHCNPNGQFAHNPEPLKENLGDLSNAVIENRADFGIAVDPDVDRLVFVDEKGELFWNMRINAKINQEVVMHILSLIHI